MARNMSVSVRLRLQDDFTRPVRNLLRTFNRLTRAAQDFNRSLGGAGSSNHFSRLQGQLMAARSKLQDVMGSVAENFKGLLPHLETVSTQFGKIARLIDPAIGNPFAGLSLLGATGLAGVVTAGRAMRGMNPWMRMLLGGGGGFLLGGDIMSAVTGAMLLRGFGGGNAAAIAAAAGASGAAAGQSWAKRFVGGAFKFIRLSIGLYLLGEVVQNWGTVSARIKAIWEDLRQAAPVWLGGEGKGWQKFAEGPALAQLNQDVDNLTRPIANSIIEWIRSTQAGQWLQARGMEFLTTRELQLRRLVGGADRAVEAAAKPLMTTTAAGKGSVQSVNVTGNPITVHVHVATNASPSAIGEAAGNAVQSGLRGLLADPMPLPP